MLWVEDRDVVNAEHGVSNVSAAEEKGGLPLPLDPFHMHKPYGLPAFRTSGM